MNYREKIQKLLTLPSGSTVVIKKLNAYDLAGLERRASDDDLTYGVRVGGYILTKKTGKIDGQFSIVEKVDDETTQVSVEELEQLDAAEIVSAVYKFSGLTKRDEEARKTFPENTESPVAAGDGSSSGAVLSGSSSNGTITPAV